MISIILGHKGAGKTKRLISCVNEAVENSKGNVVCVEKERLLTYNVNYRARLVETDYYGVNGYDAFYGFLAGIVAGRGNMFVSFIGVLIIYTLKNGLVMVGLPDFYQYLAIGIVIFLAVMVQREGKNN